MNWHRNCKKQTDRNSIGGIRFMSISVLYWSGTGNTQAMAEAIAKGIEAAGQEAKILTFAEANPEEVLTEQAFALGCPSMGAEELEDMEVEPFVSKIEGSISGKKILLFGSYGWGDGEWMREWEERMKTAGAIIVKDAGVIANEAPDEEAVAALKEAGKELASLA